MKRHRSSLGDGTFSVYEPRAPRQRSLVVQVFTSFEGIACLVTAAIVLFSIHPIIAAIVHAGDAIAHWIK